MIEDQRSDRKSRLKQQVAESMEELRQLNRMPTLDDFQNFRRKKLESNLLGLRQELRATEVEDPAMNSGRTVADS